MAVIDVSFDCRTDTPKGKDPDIHSARLRRYHKLLWSKPLPGGARFDLSEAKSDCYLYHHSDLGEFFLSSDTVIPSFRKLPHIKSLIPQQEIEAFNTLGYTIGGMMVFPANKVGGKMTINGARGCHPRIRDRFDLTLECIRRHYAGEASPLTGVLARYSDFFQLFESFRGYVDFFLLHDLVDDGDAVRIAPPFDDFRGSPVPRDAREYRAYKEHASAFIKGRNRRIQQLSIAA